LHSDFVKNVYTWFGEKVTRDPKKFFLFCRAIDKFDKIGQEGVADELSKANIDPKGVAGLFEQIRSIREEAKDPQHQLERLFARHLWHHTDCSRSLPS